MKALNKKSLLSSVVLTIFTLVLFMVLSFDYTIDSKDSNSSLVATINSNLGIPISGVSASLNLITASTNQIDIGLLDNNMVAAKYEGIDKIISDKKKMEEAEKEKTENKYYKKAKTMYTTCSVNVRSKADKDSKALDCYSVNTKVKVIGKDASKKWYVIKYNDSKAYIRNKYLDTKKVEIEENEQVTYEWEGEKLNSSNGTVRGPSGVETYYSMNMSYCVERMHRLGYNYTYWVRSDGVKMLGDYVMVAANFNIRPLGTILETSLGMGIVVDTGGFVSWRPYGLDIAVTW